MEYGVLLVLASLVVFVHGCSDLGHVRRDPDGREGDEMKVHFSEVVVYGFVDNLYDSGTPGIKTIDFTVRCSLKGNVQKRKIKVTGIAAKGVIPDCPGVNLMKDEAVILFLRRLPSNPAMASAPMFDIEFSPIQAEEDFGIDLILEEIGINCGLNVTFNGELSKENDCDLIYVMEDECVAYEPQKPMTTTTQTPNKGGNTVVVGPPVDETSEPENDGPDDTKDGQDDSYVTKTEKPAKSSGGGQAGSSVDDGNNSARQTSVSILAIMLSFIGVAFV